MSEAKHAAEPEQSTEPSETVRERRNREWTDILQELRVIQAGSQIITGFLLAAAFQPRFEDLPPVAHGIYLSLVAVAVATTIVGLTPVLLHRRLFRMKAKESLVALGGRFATAALIGVGVTLAGIMLLVVELVSGLLAGVLAAIAAVLVIAALWVLLPARVQLRLRRAGRDGE